MHSRAADKRYSLGPMSSADFDGWFAGYLGQSPIQVERLLRDKTAVRFLIAWSLVEPRCFNGFATGKGLHEHCTRIVNEEGFNPSALIPIIEHFHARYQDKNLLANLMHDKMHPDIKSLLDRTVTSLTNAEKMFFVVSVVFRFRNNIFHGSKGVASWLAFKPHIEHCTKVMQTLITHAAQHSEKKLLNFEEDVA